MFNKRIQFLVIIKPRYNYKNVMNAMLSGKIIGMDILFGGCGRSFAANLLRAIGLHACLEVLLRILSGERAPPAPHMVPSLQHTKVELYNSCEDVTHYLVS